MSRTYFVRYAAPRTMLDGSVRYGMHVWAATCESASAVGVALTGREMGEVAPCDHIATCDHSYVAG